MATIAPTAPEERPLDVVVGVSAVEATTVAPEAEAEAAEMEAVVLTDVTSGVAEATTPKGSDPFGTG